jgi:aspartyl-tRNA(Asn)/glutamyl-tRNA(Gln) amidotransferase subunit C
MEINEAMVDKLATLSRLKFNDEEKVELRKDLQNMLEFVNKLQELDTSGVEPLLHISSGLNVFREDEVQQEISREEALSNATIKDDQYFKVPKVISKP